MRKVWNDGWQFSKTAGGSEAEQAGNAQLSWEAVELPHTWNGTDGQDGGNDYYRGVCRYRKILRKEEITEDADEE